MLAVWADYSVGLWGWCLLRGYDLTFGQLVSPLHPYQGPWPPPQISPGQIFPGGSQAAQPPGTKPAPVPDPRKKGPDPHGTVQ